MDIHEALFLTLLKQKILIVALYLSDDPNYTREDAIIELVDIANFIVQETGQSICHLDIERRLSK